MLFHYDDKQVNNWTVINNLLKQLSRSSLDAYTFGSTRFNFCKHGTVYLSIKLNERKGNSIPLTYKLINSNIYNNK